ncbi:MAG: Omp28 family outer membrane lipoprotein [Saprospiraceae bacterium]|nr:Omp28 family outer membrane lipoprotein [Saprospiraceae bacterium]
MQNYLKKSAALLCAILFYSSCSEISPVIPALGPQDSGDRKVLIEEFTGVTCVNCPAGAAKIGELIALNNKNIIAVSIHSGEFSDPTSHNLYDFRTEEGDNLSDYLGSPIGYPSAVINRKKYPSESSLQVNSLTSWAGYSSEELSKSAQMTLVVENEYITSSRTLNITIRGTALSNLGSDNSLSVLITESNIIDYQYTPEGGKNDYEHKHVLRKYLTPFNGAAITDALQTGKVIERTFSIVLPNEWNAANCDVVAFVHKTANDNKEVIQVEEAAVVE